MKLKFILLLLFLFSLNSICFASTDTLWIYLLKRDYISLIERAKQIEKASHLDYSEREEIYYLKGVAYLKLNRYIEARENFHNLMTNCPRGKWFDYAYLGIADSYFLAKEFDKAIVIYQNFLSKNTRSPLRAHCYYQLSECYRRLGNWVKAKDFLSRTQNYPFSFESRMGRDIINKEQFFYSVQIGAFRNRDNAYNLNRQLKKKGFDSFILEGIKSGALIYKVRVGRFLTKQEASGVMTKLRQIGYSTSLVP
jgi:tetratricopeptide (TPR) repeat protein